MQGYELSIISVKTCYMSIPPDCGSLSSMLGLFIQPPYITETFAGIISHYATHSCVPSSYKAAKFVQL